jgi:hypothetical protein
MIAKKDRLQRAEADSSKDHPSMEKRVVPKTRCYTILFGRCKKTFQEEHDQFPKLLLTESEAAVVLNISKRLLWTISNQGLIDFIRLGNAKRYTYASLEQFIQKQTEKAKKK